MTLHVVFTLASASYSTPAGVPSTADNFADDTMYIIQLTLALRNILLQSDVKP